MTVLEGLELWPYRRKCVILDGLHEVPKPYIRLSLFLLLLHLDQDVELCASSPAQDLPAAVLSDIMIMD